MLSGYKTYITGAVSVITAVALYLTGTDTLAQTIQLVVTAIIGMTIRNAIPTVTK